MNTKSLYFNFWFRLSNFITKYTVLKIIGFPIRLFYKFHIQWVLGIDIPDTTQIGKNLELFHGQGLVIHSATIIGDNVILRHNTTIGNAKPKGGCPVIGDNVEIGANSVIIGEIVIGDNSIIAAGSVVVKDVPKNVIVAGNPAKIIKILK